MTSETGEHYRLKLEARREELEAMSAAAKDSRKPVELDQQAVGRLSRQDALQQQAMANAQDVRRMSELRKIKLALARLDKGEYGFCCECSEPIAPRRLEIDLTAMFCASCAR
ncbi:TraR/DksA family transcriptional regulator [Hyphococcus sp.]|uniref:TraR/DksA family transcriptional regulator n=1 Tax=Hyphococcus sp. TaxID=2038636 RepID=UPI00207DAE1F|nr:MAG: molecular chaperone DnaK [Marinicaulis sp.]